MSTNDPSTPLAVVQRLYECFGAGDVPGLMALLGDDLRWQFHGDSRAPYTGHVDKAGLPAWLGQVAEADAIERFEPREMLAGGDIVTVLGWERSTMRPGNGGVECDWIHVFEVRGGLVRRFVGMLDTERAARARTGG
jgi:hypothetical protein